MLYNKFMKVLSTLVYLLYIGLAIFGLFNSDYFYLEWALLALIFIALLLYIIWGIWQDKKLSYLLGLITNFLVLAFIGVGLVGMSGCEGLSCMAGVFLLPAVVVQLVVVALTTRYLVSGWKKVREIKKEGVAKKEKIETGKTTVKKPKFVEILTWVFGSLVVLLFLPLFFFTMLSLQSIGDIRDWMAYGRIEGELYNIVAMFLVSLALVVSVLSMFLAYFFYQKSWIFKSIIANLIIFVSSVFLFMFDRGEFGFFVLVMPANIIFIVLAYLIMVSKKKSENIESKNQ